MEVMLEGDANGRGYQYPIPTYNITKEFDWEHPNCELLFSMTAKYGTPYFSNFVNLILIQKTSGACAVDSALTSVNCVSVVEDSWVR